MNNAQIINDLIMQCAKYKKDAEYLAGERDYWKQQARTKADMSAITPDSVRSEREMSDSREKLEEDVDNWCAEHINTPFSGKAFNTMLSWLERQDAITRAKCESELAAVDWWTDENGDTHAIAANGEEVCHYAKGEHAEAVNKTIAELEAENAELRDTIVQNALRARNEDMLKPQWRAEIEELEAKNDELQNNVYELKGELEWRTCSLEYDGKWLICSNCGESLQWFGIRTVYKTDGKQERALGVEGVRFCPFCGGKIAEVGE